jgi:hypothetical protein
MCAVNNHHAFSTRRRQHDHVAQAAATGALRVPAAAIGKQRL